MLRKVFKERARPTLCRPCDHEVWPLGHRGSALNLCGSPVIYRALSLGRSKPDARVGPIAERLGGTAPAATQLRARHAGNHAAGATRDLQVAADRQGAIDLRIDGQCPVAYRKGVSLAAGGLARGIETNF